MSQELYYTRVATVRETQQFQRNFGPVIAQVLNSAPIEVVSGVKKCCKRKRTKTKSVLAPTELTVIQTDFDKHIAVAQDQKQVAETQLKVAAIATLVKSQENLIVSSPSVVAESIQRIIDAPTVQETNKEIKATFKEIKSQHTQSFAANVSVAVKESAIAVGFKEVKIMQDSLNLTRIVATNSSGQNLIAEIDTSTQVDIRTELIGYTDGSCEKVIRAFDNELSVRGITTKVKKQKATNGIPQMPYAQKLVKPKKIVQRTFDDEAAISENEQQSVITIKR